MRAAVSDLYEMYRYTLDPHAPMTRIVMLSGGIDSCAALLDELAGTKNQVHAHHIKLEGAENRDRAEGEAVAEIMRYCRRKHRPFAFTTSAIRWPSVGHANNALRDSQAVAFVAGGIARLVHQAMKMEGTIHPIEAVIGNVKEDHFRGEIAEYEKTTAYRGLQMAFESCVIELPEPRPRLAFTVAHLTKAQTYQMVPQALRYAICSCRTPQYVGDEIVRCGVCHACRHLNQIERSK